MSSDPIYALGKFTTAVMVLATGEGNCNSRLFEAFECISPVFASDLPEEYREEFKEITSNLRKHGRGMRNKTAAKIAMGILELEMKLDDRFGCVRCRHPGIGGRLRTSGELTLDLI